jgi:hypothetical protein
MSDSYFSVCAYGQLVNCAFGLRALSKVIAIYVDKDGVSLRSVGCSLCYRALRYFLTRIVTHLNLSLRLLAI